MSEHGQPGHGEPRRPGEIHTADSVQYDTDINVRGVVWSAVWLAVGTLVSMLLMYWLFLGLRSYNKAQDPAPPALREVNERRLPPLPRLQLDPDKEMLELRASEDRLIHRASWIDQNAGTLRLPIDLAIDVIARRGLPATSPAATPVPTPAPTLAAPPKAAGGRP